MDIKPEIKNDETPSLTPELLTFSFYVRLIATE